MAFELPEILNMAKQMNDEIIGSQITDVIFSKCESLIKQGFINEDLDVIRNKCVGQTVQRIYSRGKWLIIELDNRENILIAIETNGHILLSSKPKPNIKYKVCIVLDDSRKLLINIIGWGFFKLLSHDKIWAGIYPGELGVEPIENDRFTFNYFYNLIKTYPRNVKEFFINQRQVAGIGNGYLQDILLVATIHPKKRCREISKEEANRLYEAILKVINDAINKKGRNNKVDLYGEPGTYEHLLCKEKEGYPCPNCGELIEKIRVNGSSSYICNKCQGL